MYTLFVQDRARGGDDRAKKAGGGGGLAKDSEAREILSLAKHHDVDITYRTKHDLNLMSDNRPHQVRSGDE